MASSNRFTKQQAENLRNERFTLITFNKEGERVGTYASITALELTKELLRRQNSIILLFNTSDIEGLKDWQGNLEYWKNVKSNILSR